jgi:hypothetical protein
MTQINPPQVELDDMLPEYDFSKGIRGKHAHRVGKPYTVTIRNSDGTATLQHFDASGNMTPEKHQAQVEGSDHGQ